VCGNSARTDLYGGRPVMTVPTVTGPRLQGQGRASHCLSPINEGGRSRLATRELPQHILKDAAILVIENLLRRVDAHGGWEVP
jgi:hypothetical protein